MCVCFLFLVYQLEYQVSCFSAVIAVEKDDFFEKTLNETPGKDRVHARNSPPIPSQAAGETDLSHEIPCKSASILGLHVLKSVR